MLLVLSFYSLLLLWSSSVQSVDSQLNVGQSSPHLELLQKVLQNITHFPSGTFSQLDNCLDKLAKELAKRDDLIKQAKIKVDKIWVTNQPQTLKTKVTVDGTVKVANLLVSKKVIITKPVIKNAHGNHSDLESRLNRAEKAIENINRKVEHEVVRKDKANQVINGIIHFLGPIKADRITIETIRPNTLINGISWEELKTNVLRKSGNQTVTGNWNFKSTLAVDNLQVNGLLSGINMSDILLTNSPKEQVINGRLKIERGNFRSLFFESINGIGKDELVFKLHYPLPITGNKRFTQVQSMANINLTGLLNGHNWNRLVRNSVNINSPTSIPTTLRFATVPTINNLNARSVNNIRIDNLKSGLTQEELIQLSGSKTFRQLSASNVTLRGKLNGLSIPNDLLTLRSLQNLSKPIIFDGHVSFTSKLTSIGTINDVDLVRDVVYRQSATSQIISGAKIFDNSVRVRNLNSKVNKLRHINLDTLDPNASDGAQFARRSNVVYDDQLTINGSLNVKTINGISIDKLIGGLFSRSRDQVISWPTQFNGSLSVDSVTTTTVNGLRFPEDLVLINTNRNEQVITGQKTFESVTLGSENELVMEGHTLNGNNLKSLEKSVIKNDPLMRKDCYGKKRFSSVKVLGNIVAEKVNGLNLKQDVMLVDRPQNITGKLVFTSDVQAYQVSFPSGLQVKNINGRLVDENLNNLVLHDSQSVTLEDKDFRGGLVADEIDLLGTINGVNLTNLISSVVNLDSPQAIYSPLKFEDEVTFDHPIDTRSINGYDLLKQFSSVIGNSAPLENRNIKITGNVRINGDLITGRLNHQPAENLKNFIFQPKIDNKFDRPVIFSSPVTIDHLTVDKTATLDGISFDDLLPLDKPIQLDNPMVIRGNVHIDQQLIVRSGIINKCSLHDMTLLTEYRNKSNALHIHRPINFNQVNILGNLRLIGSKINGIDFDQLSDQVQIATSTKQRFNSSFTFADNVYVDELFVSGLINGVDLQAIYADSVRKSAGHQKITGHKVFKSLQINNGDVTFAGNVQLRGTINGINVTQLYDNLIKPGTFNVVRGVKIFTSNQPIIFHNIESPSLGGVNLSDFMSVSSSETIPTDTTFTEPITVNNLETRKHHGRRLINQQNLIQFMDPVNVKQLSVKRINGIPIENFVSTLKDTQLNGSYTINSLYIHGDLVMNSSSTINGVDLSEIKNRSVDVRSSNFIPGVVVLEGKVNLEQGINLTNDPVNGPGASERLKKSLGNATGWLEMDLRRLENELEKQTMLLARLNASIDLDAMKFDSFDVLDYFSDYEIDSNHVEKISISKDYRPINGKSVQGFNQGLTRTIYLQYADRSNGCQRKTSTFDVPSIEKQPIKDGLINADGKYFPSIIFPTGNNNSIGISAWTNLPDCEIDADHLDKFNSNITVSYPTSGPLFVKSYRFPVTFSDINYFWDNDKIFFISLRSIKITPESSSLYIYQLEMKRTAVQSVFSLIQQLDESNAVSMEIINSQKLSKKLLAIMKKPFDCSQNATIVIYEWSPGNRKFSKIGSVSAPNPLSMKFIEIPRRGLINLIVANNLETGVCAHDKLPASASSLVNIYGLTNNLDSSIRINVNLKQSIDLNANSISSFMVGSENYLVLSSKSSDTIFIYKHQGDDQFKEDQRYTAKGVEDVKCFWSSSDTLFMIATTTDHHKATIYSAYLTYSTYLT